MRAILLSCSSSIGISKLLLLNFCLIFVFYGAARPDLPRRRRTAAASAGTPAVTVKIMPLGGLGEVGKIDGANVSRAEVKAFADEFKANIRVEGVAKAQAVEHYHRTMATGVVTLRGFQQFRRTFGE